ncbi:uroporphyrinogen-III synthase [Rhizobium sp. YIM 134829]|uniref:uroporphyrinogen-III synthase n=1 Tax=Rhizobium sp. YIM 134829 TaxID=3390453 RepID=UPI003979C3A0
MRVLVTRPARAAEATAAALRQRGHVPLLLPLTVPLYPDLVWPEMNPGALIATSAEAFRAIGRGAIGHAFKSRPVYCVGPATAAAAADLGFQDCRVGPGEAAGLVELIRADQRTSEAPLLYLAGVPRLPALEEGLKAAGLPLQVMDVYRMEPVAVGDLSAQLAALKPEAVLFYSREAVRLFFSALSGPLATPLDLLCLSPAIAAAVPPGAGRVHVAAQPEEVALLDRLDALAAS